MYVVLIVRKFDSHDLISLRGERSEFFGFDSSEIFFTENFHRNERVTIDAALDVSS